MERTNFMVGWAIIVVVGMIPYSGNGYDQETILLTINTDIKDSYDAVEYG